ncbi:MAG: hypothetical protein AVDCRST_MAG30-357 [uncultured Solirubrobacteraceae bacterium]|uniref:Glycosyltransferase RgtA/B/C/D-like domain-containing protein n=1 Tax=uncultured Solirubrobacteraceae bacterium TaxID=1162706 RepID=A0A6J4RJV1_9ACTN|nr:MAG: hypothetical protein AVDCRST_MAG30-357 [uncultured Solirubrobacteraceae bacterium]
MRLALGRLRDRPVLLALAAIILVGGALRLWLMVRWRPAFTGYPDSGIYLLDARGGPFYDPLRIGGYGLYLRWFHDLIRDDLSSPILAQHLMGMGSGVLLFGAVRRLAVPAWLALIPAAAILLGGAEIFVEHAVLSEGVYILGLCGGLYALVRAAAGGTSPRAAAAWAALGSLALALSTTVRLAGIFVLGVAAIHLLAYGGATWRARVASTAAAAVVAAVVLIGFQAYHEAKTGRWGFTRAGVYNLYGRVAPWADCSKFTPPAGTRQLCDDRPVEERPAHDAYLFADSPLVRAYGPPTAVPPEGAAAQISSFSRAAILGQPGAYVSAVGRELLRVVDPSVTSRPGGRRDGEGLGPDEFATKLLDPYNDVNIIPITASHFSTRGVLREDIGALQAYERATRPPPLLMALLIALAAVAPFSVPRAVRRGSVLLSLTALVMLTTPVVTNVYDWRYVIPALGPLAAAAALGGWAVGAAARRRLQRGGGLAERIGRR